ncbi:hypothetical protein BOX15_Mlig011045g2, partial [Macrostomum lignano]
LMPTDRKTKWNATWLSEHDHSGVKISRWCQKDDDNDDEATCRLCNRGVNFRQHGIAALRQHADGAKHKALSRAMVAAYSQQKINAFFPITPSENQQLKKVEAEASLPQQTMAASLRFGLLVVRKDLSFKTMDEISETLPVAIPDSSVAQNFSCGRTKTTYLVTDALAPHAKEEMFKSLRDSPFSILLDEGTKRDRCWLVLLARTFCIERQKVILVYIGSEELKNSSASNMKDTVLSLLSQAKLPARNVISVMTDSCNAMRGIHNGLLTKLKDAMPQLIDVGGCSLHHVHNSVQYATKAFDSTGEAEGLMDDVYNYFRFVKRRGAFHEIQDALDLAEHVFIRRVETRWLQILNVIRRILEQWEALKLHFEKASASELDNIRARRIKLALTDEMLAKLQFLSQVLPRCEAFEKIFQRESTQVHHLASSLEKLFSDILLCFMRSEVVENSRSLSDLVDRATDRNNQLMNKDLIIGSATRETVARLRQMEQIGFFKSVRCFFSEIISRLFAYLPFNNKVLSGLQFVDPEYMLGSDFNFDNSILRVGRAMSTVISADLLDDIRLEATRLRLTCPTEKAKETPEAFWAQLSVEDYPHLSKLGRAACCIPHGNADSERVLKWVANNLTKQRNRLGEVTLDSILAVKVWMKCNSTGPAKVTIDSNLLDTAFQAKSKADERRRAKQNEKAMKRLQQALEEQRRLVTEKEKELQQQKQQKQAEAQTKIDEMRKKAQDMLALADKEEHALRKRHGDSEEAKSKKKKK